MRNFKINTARDKGLFMTFNNQNLKNEIRKMAHL